MAHGKVKLEAMEFHNMGENPSVEVLNTSWPLGVDADTAIGCTPFHRSDVSQCGEKELAGGTLLMTVLCADVVLSVHSASGIWAVLGNVVLFADERLALAGFEGLRGVESPTRPGDRSPAVREE